MNKIVLTGAPGSGKTRLAYDLQEALEKAEKGVYKVIDHYAEDVADRVNFGIGPLASHITDMAIAIERLGQEYYEKTIKRQDKFIVCGSIAETAINTALTCSTLQTDASWETGQVIAPLYPLLQRSSGISKTFLLPLGDDPDDYEIIIYDSLPSALEALGIEYYELNKNHEDLWVEDILKLVFDIDYEEKEVDDTEDSVKNSGEVD